jgi:tRNA pseudouridine55 synthase
MPDGFLNIHKEPGMTSFDVVARVRRILKTKRAGHAGTLDPDATGVLVVAVGSATRLLPYLPTEPKIYAAHIAFGVATDTEDASGVITAQADASTLTLDALNSVLPRFIGQIEQIPPMVSAVHHQGRRLYELAREGITVERAPRAITIHSLQASDFVPGERAEAALRVVCGGGAYIRTLCFDIGVALNLPAHMKSLIREAVGPFHLSHALTLDALVERGEGALESMEKALPFTVITVSDSDYENLRLGKAIPFPISAGEITSGADITRDPNDPLLAIYSLLHRERLLALARHNDGILQPFKVFVGGDS